MFIYLKKSNYVYSKLNTIIITNKMFSNVKKFISNF